jgi:hypothetical protein
MSASAEPLRSLGALQHWLSLAVTTPGGLASGLARAGERYGDESVIRARPGVNSSERLAIYARGYLDRLRSCLRAEFPAVAALVGDELFERFATGYVWTRPPRGPSLFTLGANFADYLELTRPPLGSVPEASRALLELPIDLARVERARLEVLQAPGVEDEPARLHGDFDALFGEELIVAATPCLRVVTAAHDVRAFIAAVDVGAAPETPGPKRVELAISRVEYRPVLSELSPWQALALRFAAEALPLHRLAAEVASVTNQSVGTLLADLVLWLPIAESFGMLRGVR